MFNSKNPFLMRQTELNNSYPLLGILLILGFAVLGPVMDTFAKLASPNIPIGQIVFFRFLVQSVILIPIAIILKIVYIPKGREVFLHFSRAFFILTATSFFFAAIKYMPMADALAIFFINPFIITLLGKIFLNETLGWRRLIACIIGFLGTTLIIKPSFSLFGFVAFYPLITAITFSAYMVLTRYMTNSIHPITLQTYTGLSAVIIIIPLLLIFKNTDFKELSPVWPDMYNFALLIGVGSVASISHIFVVYGLKYAPASAVAPILYLEIVSAALLGYFIFDDIPDILSIFGLLIIISSGIYIFMREHYLNKVTI